MNDSYDTYVRAIHMMGESLGLPIEPMSARQFARAQVESDFTFSSVIDMDLFEAAFGE